MTAYDVPPPPPPRRTGCSTLAVGCAGMILGSILTIAVQLMLVGYGIDLLTRGFRNAAEPARPSSPPSVTSTVEQVPDGFGGYSVSYLAQHCGGDPFEAADRKLHAACDEMRAYMRQHGAAPDIIP